MSSNIFPFRFTRFVTSVLKIPVSNELANGMLMPVTVNTRCDNSILLLLCVDSISHTSSTRSTVLSTLNWSPIIPVYVMYLFTVQDFRSSSRWFAKINTRIYVRWQRDKEKTRYSAESLSFVVLNSTLRNYVCTTGSRMKLVDPGEGVLKYFVFLREWRRRGSKTFLFVQETVQIKIG